MEINIFSGRNQNIFQAESKIFFKQHWCRTHPALTWTCSQLTSVSFERNRCCCAQKHAEVKRACLTVRTLRFVTHPGPGRDTSKNRDQLTRGHVVSSDLLLSLFRTICFFANPPIYPFLFSSLINRRDNVAKVVTNAKKVVAMQQVGGAYWLSSTHLSLFGEMRSLTPPLVS